MVLVVRLPPRLLVDCCFGIRAGLVQLPFRLWLRVPSDCQLQAAPAVPPLQVDCCFGLYNKIVPSASCNNTKWLGNLSSTDCCLDSCGTIVSSDGSCVRLDATIQMVGQSHVSGTAGDILGVPRAAKKYFSAWFRPG